MSVFLVKLLLEIISLNSGLVLNCQLLLYPIRVVMIRQVPWTTWQFQEPVQMLRIDGLHGKQVLIMTGHLSCLVTLVIWPSALSTIYQLISIQTGQSDFQKNMLLNTMSVKKFQIFQMMSIMLNVIPTIHSTMLPTGKKLNISKLQDNYLQVKQTTLHLIRLKLMLFVCVWRKQMELLVLVWQKSLF